MTVVKVAHLNPEASTNQGTEVETWVDPPDGSKKFWTAEYSFMTLFIQTFRKRNEQLENRGSLRISQRMTLLRTSAEQDYTKYPSGKFQRFEPLAVLLQR